MVADKKGQCKCKDGYLEKYSVGSRFTLRRNWKRRFIKSTPEGMMYYKDQNTPKPQGMVPYGFDTTLFTKVDASIHPQANDPSYSYFAIQFTESQEKSAKMILLRSTSSSDKAEWCSALSTMMARAD